MKINHKLKAFLTILLFISIMMQNSSAGIPATWGVEEGDTIIYELKEAILSNEESTTDIAGSLPDSNKTVVIIITSIGSDYLNYSLGLNNGSRVFPNQQLSVERIDINGFELIAPNGSLPIVLPVSIEGYNVYMQKLASDIQTLDFVLSEMFRDQENITVNTGAVLTTNGFLNISGSVSSSNISVLNDIMGFNISEVSFQNETLLGIDIEVNLAYSRNTGLLVEFGLDGSLRTNSTEYGQITRSFNVTILQTDHFNFQGEVPTTNNDSPINFKIVVIALILFGSRIRRQQK